MPIRLVFCFLVLTASQLDAQHYHLRSIGTDEGLPGPTVYAMLQDSVGYLWFATNQGLCRYDGSGFKLSLIHI